MAAPCAAPSSAGCAGAATQATGISSRTRTWVRAATAVRLGGQGLAHKLPKWLPESVETVVACRLQGPGLGGLR